MPTKGWGSITKRRTFAEKERLGNPGFCGAPRGFARQTSREADFRVDPVV
jgi:hypothetical protein